MKFEDIHAFLEEYSDNFLDDSGVFYENRMVAGLYFTYLYKFNYQNPFVQVESQYIQSAFQSFKDWASIEIAKMIEDVDVIYDEYIDGMDEEDDEEYVEEAAIEVCVKYILAWNKWEYLKKQLEEDNFHEIKEWDELIKQLEEYKDFSDWDDIIENYIDEIPSQLIPHIFGG